MALRGLKLPGEGIDAGMPLNRAGPPDRFRLGFTGAEGRNPVDAPNRFSLSARRRKNSSSGGVPEASGRVAGKYLLEGICGPVVPEIPGEEQMPCGAEAHPSGEAGAPARKLFSVFSAGCHP